MTITDLTTFLIVGIISGVVGLVLLYFVVKNAIKNALIEDRAFQAKVARMKVARMKDGKS